MAKSNQRKPSNSAVGNNDNRLNSESKLSNPKQQLKQKIADRIIDEARAEAEEFKRKYDAEVEQFREELESKESESQSVKSLELDTNTLNNGTIGTTASTEEGAEIKSHMEGKNMAKDMSLDMDLNLDEEAMKNLEKEINTDKAEPLPGNESTGTSKKGDKIDIDALESKIAQRSQTGNVEAATGKVTAFLRDNVLLKQFVTGNAYGRALTVATSQVGVSKTKVSRLKTDILKPGTAKVAIVTMPTAIQEIFASASGNHKEVIRQIAALDIEQIDTTQTVDVVMQDKALRARVANLMGGEIAEFGALADGPLAVGTSKKFVTDGVAGKEATQYVEKAVETNTRIIKGVKHAVYKMDLPSATLLSQVADNVINSQMYSEPVKGQQLTAEQKAAKQIKDFKDGKKAFKRAKGAASPLYTEKNFSSISRYATAQPFSGNLSDADAVSLSAKACYQIEKATLFNTSDKALLGDGKVVALFGKDAADKRYANLCVAENYLETDANGKPIVKRVAKKDANGNVVKENGQIVYVEEPVKAKRKLLADRVPRNYFTGEPISAENMAAVAYVKFGSPVPKKDNSGTLTPRAIKYRVDIEGAELDNKTNAYAGGFGMDDAALKNLMAITTEEVAIEAVQQAVKRSTSKSGAGSEATIDSAAISAALQLF